MRSLRAVLRGAPFGALVHGDPRGTPELRNALTSYLGRARGAAPEPEHTLISSGFAQAFAILCRAAAATVGSSGSGSRSLASPSTG